MTFQSAFFDELRKIAATFNGIEFDHAMNLRDHYPEIEYQTNINSQRENPSFPRKDIKPDMLAHPGVADDYPYFFDRAMRRAQRIADTTGSFSFGRNPETLTMTNRQFNDAADARMLGYSLISRPEFTSPRILFTSKKSLPPQPRSVVVRPLYDRPPNSPYIDDYSVYNREGTRNTIAHEAFHANNPRLGRSELLAHIYGGYRAPLPGSSIFKRLRGGLSGAKEYWRKVDAGGYARTINTPQGPKKVKGRKYW